MPYDRVYDVRAMMSAEACRAKAADALMREAEATNPSVKAIYAIHAREWTALALAAEAHEDWEGNLGGATNLSNSDTPRLPR